MSHDDPFHIWFAAYKHGAITRSELRAHLRIEARRDTRFMERELPKYISRMTATAQERFAALLKEK
jgi:hypothetical protein